MKSTCRIEIHLQTGVNIRLPERLYNNTVYLIFEVTVLGVPICSRLCLIAVYFEIDSTGVRRCSPLII